MNKSKRFGRPRIKDHQDVRVEFLITQDAARRLDAAAPKMSRMSRHAVARMLLLRALGLLAAVLLVGCTVRETVIEQLPPPPVLTSDLGGVDMAPLPKLSQPDMATVDMIKPADLLPIADLARATDLLQMPTPPPVATPTPTPTPNPSPTAVGGTGNCTASNTLCWNGTQCTLNNWADGEHHLPGDLCTLWDCDAKGSCSQKGTCDYGYCQGGPGANCSGSQPCDPRLLCTSATNAEGSCYLPCDAQGQCPSPYHCGWNNQCR